MATSAVRGQNFSVDELKQLAVSWVNVSEDPIVGNSQKNQSFWDRVAKHYNRNRPVGTPERPDRSLESKWGDMKHDVAKFSGAYANVEDLRISGSSVEDTLSKARQLYQQKHPKGKHFGFEDCWILLKDNPKFSQCVDDMATKAQAKGGRKRRGQQAFPEPEQPPPDSPTEVLDAGTDRSAHAVESNGGGNESSSTWQQRPIGNKSAKKARNEECAFKIAANATKSIAATNERRTLILEKQSIQSLFTQRASDVDEEIREDFRRNRMREVMNLRRQLDMLDAAEIRNARTAPSRGSHPAHVEEVHEQFTDVLGDGIGPVDGTTDGPAQDLAAEFVAQEGETFNEM